MGIDYRVVNGYIYISVNPVTDPAKIAERAEFFQNAPATTSSTGTSSTPSGAEDGGAARGAHGAPGPDAEYEPDEVMFGDEDTSFYEVLDAYSRTLRMRSSCGSTTSSSCSSATA